MGVAIAVGYHHGNHRAFGRICGAGDGGCVVVGVIGRINGDRRSGGINIAFIRGFAFITGRIFHTCVNGIFAFGKRFGHIYTVVTV